MKHSTILSLATVTLTAIAVPRNPTSDRNADPKVEYLTGIYGIKAKRLADNPTTNSTSAIYYIERLDGFGISANVQCTGFTISSNSDYESAQSCFEVWLRVAAGHWKSYGKTWYFCQTGRAILGLCNYTRQVQGDVSGIQLFNAVLDRECGMWQSGYIDLRKWGKGYWRSLDGAMVVPGVKAYPCDHNGARDRLDQDMSWQ